MLVLLIVFMVTAPMLGSTVEIDLARADTGRAAAQPDEPPIVVTVTQDGKVYVGDDAAPDPEATLSAALAKRTSKAISVRADGRCAYQDVTGAIAAARRAGATGVELVFDPSRAQ